VSARPISPRLRDLLDAAEAGTRSTPPLWPHALPPLYVYALDALAEAGGRFTESNAAAALRGAADRLVLPDAPPFGAQPDPADVPGFLGKLEAEELAMPDGQGGYILDSDRLPF
jgi:hypothetical protein